MKRLYPRADYTTREQLGKWDEPMKITALLLLGPYPGQLDMA